MERGWNNGDIKMGTTKYVLKLAQKWAHKGALLSNIRMRERAHLLYKDGQNKIKYMKERERAHLLYKDGHYKICAQVGTKKGT